MRDGRRRSARTGCPEGGVGRCEHHAQNDRFRDRQRSKEQTCEQRSGDDRQRQSEAEQTRRNGVFATKRSQVDA